MCAGGRVEGGVTRLCLILADYITNSRCWTGSSKICCLSCGIWRGGGGCFGLICDPCLPFWNKNFYFMLLYIESMRLVLFLFLGAHIVFLKRLIS